MLRPVGLYLQISLKHPFYLLPFLSDFALPSVRMVLNWTCDTCLSQKEFSSSISQRTEACLMALLLAETSEKLLFGRFAALLVEFHQPNGTHGYSSSVLLRYLFYAYPLPVFLTFH